MARQKIDEAGWSCRWYANSSFPSYPTLLSHVLNTLPIYEDEPNLNVSLITCFPD